MQSYCPHSHTIIEAHPDVYAHMLAEGWGDRPGVTLLHGRWQDVLSALGTFDGIFFDTCDTTICQQQPRLDNAVLGVHKTRMKAML